MTKTTKKALCQPCYNCQKKNHLWKCCKASQKAVTQSLDQEESRTESESEGYESLAISPKERTKSIKLTVENVEITMIIDS